jgi:hypothetical protein
MIGRVLLSGIAAIGIVCPASANAASPSRFMVQIGAFPTAAEAAAAASSFKQKRAAAIGDVATEVLRTDLGDKGVWYRVLAGPFVDRRAADRACGTLKAAGTGCFVVAAEAQVQLRGPITQIVPGADSSSGAVGADLPSWIVAPQASASSSAQPSAASSSSPSTSATSTKTGPEAGFERALRSAEQGEAKAQLEIAGLYREGRGVARNEAAAFRWYRAAAENGLPEAQFELGKAYDMGMGGPRDPFEAVRWYRLSAQQGFGRAQYNLGSMHGNGEGVPTDYVKAYMWFSIAEATLKGTERDAARSAKSQAAQVMMPDELGRAVQMAQRCITSAYQNCD